jgi:neurofibromin 1
VLTRATLVGVSTSCIGLVVDTLVQLLEDLSKPYKGIHLHPVHVLHSELYVLELLAECCSKHWASVNTSRHRSHELDGEGSDSGSSTLEHDLRNALDSEAHYDKKRRASRNKLLARNTPPEPLADDLVKRLMDSLKLFARPLSEGYVLPAANILDDVFRGVAPGDMLSGPENTSSANGHPNDTETSQLLLDKSDAIDAFTRNIMEYVSFANWPRVLDYLKSALQQAAHQPAGNPGQASSMVDDDRSALIGIRLISSFWVDGRKLSILIQELCGCFLHLRKAFQTTVAIVLPLLITRWLERNPDEFIELHSAHHRLDGGAETLFDMSNTMFDGGRRKALLYPFQTTLLFLLPDVFEVASNMRDVKSSSIAKKVSFLEMLRKALRNRNETAIFCLTSVLRVARHFPLESDAALLSYALDVQEEIREAVFRRYTPGMDAQNIDIALMTAAFVSLAHLNFEACVENLAPLCLATNAPPAFKIAVISACSHFARQSNAEEYQPLFANVAEFVRAQLKVFLSSIF